VELDEDATELLLKLEDALKSMPVDQFTSPASLAKSLGAEVMLSPLKPPRRGWTWFRRSGALIEVAEWAPPEIQWLVAAHEICHLVLGPGDAAHDRTTERVCNWGAEKILERLGVQQDPLRS
jgi:hypothetical protein